MNSSTDNDSQQPPTPTPSRESPRRWILTTCRSRLEHLKVGLPTFLDRMPNWDPVVVCADDPEATQWVRRCLSDAKRGICVDLRQDGGKFNKLEALRCGIRMISALPGPRGTLVPVEDPTQVQHLPFAEVRNADMVALLDADTVALRSTARTFELVASHEVGISSTGTGDDYGLLVASAATLIGAMARIPIGYAAGYGCEDMLIRVACWLERKAPFRLIAPCWARRQHSDSLRALNYGLPVTTTAQALTTKLGEFIRANVPPDETWRLETEVFPRVGPALRARRQAS